MADFPDLNKDGKVTRADVLKGRGVEGFNDGGMAKNDELPQDMVDRLKREENAANPMVKLRDKIFGPDKKKPEPVKKAKGGMVGSASKRADGCAIRGKTKGRMI
jgi:hypothetical protein